MTMSSTTPIDEDVVDDVSETYEPPVLVKHGSLKDLTLSVVGLSFPR
jgi:hypothetical protein